MCKKDLENHMKTHTGVGLLLCTHCKKKITTKTAMCAHAKIHLNEVHTCSICGQSFMTRMYLLQHSQGKHGKGYIALCRAQYIWPKICSIMKHIEKTVSSWTKGIYKNKRKYMNALEKEKKEKWKEDRKKQAIY